MDAPTFRLPRVDAPLRELTEYLARALWLNQTTQDLLAQPPASWPVGSQDPVGYRHFVTRLAEALSATDLPEHRRGDLLLRRQPTELIDILGQMGGAWVQPFIETARRTELADRLKLQTTLQLAATETFNPSPATTAYILWRSYQTQNVAAPVRSGYWVATLLVDAVVVGEVEDADVRPVVAAYLSFCDRARGRMMEVARAG